MSASYGKNNIVHHAFIEIGNGFRFAPKRYHWQANKYIYVMVSSTNLPSLHWYCKLGISPDDLMDVTTA
jgi:hypothetical protein